MPSWWEPFLTWMRDNQIGDLSGVFGVMTSIFGFLATIITLIKTKNAAQRTEIASNEIKQSIRLFETVTDFTSAIHTLEEIKRIHRTDQLFLLPDKYSSIRKILIPLLSRQQLSPEQAVIIDTAIVNLKNMEVSVDRSMSTGRKIKASTLNNVLLSDIDNLSRVLSELKATNIGV